MALRAGLLGSRETPGSEAVPYARSPSLQELRWGVFAIRTSLAECGLRGSGSSRVPRTEQVQMLGSDRTTPQATNSSVIVSHLVQSLLEGSLTAPAGLRLAV